MNDLKEKTNRLVEELCYCDLRTEVGVDKAKALIRLTISSRVFENQELRDLLPKRPKRNNNRDRESWDFKYGRFFGIESSTTPSN